MKLSVIIPIYKVEETLERCVTSILNQSYRDMEIILVDDGSPDRCPEMCDEWEARDSRVIVVHKQNGGLSDARNAGIDRASGRYITFVDSDDYIAPDTYSQVMAVMENSINADNAPADPENHGYDIVEYSADLFVGGRNYSQLNLPDTVYTDMDDYWLKCKAYTHTYAWNKIYRRELFDTVRFPKGVLFEDVHTLPLLLERCRRVATTSRGRYFYTANPKGITATADGRALAMLLEAHTRKEITDSEYYLHVLNIQIDVCRMTNDSICLNEIKRLEYRGSDVKLKIKAFLYNLLGLNKFCALFKLCH